MNLDNPKICANFILEMPDSYGIEAIQTCINYCVEKELYETAGQLKEILDSKKDELHSKGTGSKEESPLPHI